MDEYYNAFICKGGHCIVANYDSNRNHIDEFCTICGAEIINTCPHCSAPIRGNIIRPSIVYAGDFHPSAYCYKCGNPYPWTASALQAAAEIIQDDDEMPGDQKDKLISSLPDIINETPKTPLAVSRFKKAFNTACRVTSDFLKQFMVEFGSEMALKLLGLK